MKKHYGGFSLEPEQVAKINTKYRTIKTEIPVPESIPILERLLKYEPRSMYGQPPIIWDKAEGFQVYDAYGNKWIDLSSGVLVANAGHSNPSIIESIKAMLEQKLLFNYCFPSEVRSLLVEKLANMTPKGLDKVFLVTTGSEATENAIKLSRTWGQTLHKDKIGIISFNNDFHGRTLGAQLIGGTPSLKTWIKELPKGFYQIPFPDNYYEKDISFDLFLKYIKDFNLDPKKEIASVIFESFQGGGASFAPKEYMQKLAEWCKENDILVVADEVQSGFGRTGKMFAFEHYSITPDVICCGKGITSSLPMAAIISKAEIMDIFEPRTMTSTHSGSPLCAAASLANIKFIEENQLVNKAYELGEKLHQGLSVLRKEFPEQIGAVHGKGLVAGIHIIKDGKPNGEKAFELTDQLIKKGLMLYSPVGKNNATLKVTPPLVINQEAIEEILEVLEEVFRGDS